MKKNAIYVFILAFLIGVLVSYSFRAIAGLPTNLLGILISNVFGLVVVWLYFTLKHNRGKD